MKDLLLASILLTTPPGTPEPEPTQEMFDILAPSVYELAVQWEILDDREGPYRFRDKEDWPLELDALRRRYVLLKDAPPLADALRLPPLNVINARLRFNTAYRKHLDKVSPLFPGFSSQFQRAMEEAQMCYLFWDKVRDARQEFYNVEVRRGALLRIRDWIGEEDYRAGNLPDWVPSWRFNDLKK